MSKQGFPFQLPYVHFAPDYYNALYGLGGAKIVTIIGFFGVICSLKKSEFNNRSKLCFLVAMSNFIVPSYLLGIIAGVISLGIIYIRNIKFIAILLALSIVITPYLLFRLNTLGFSSFGDIPKIKAVYILFDLWKTYPITIFTGTGAGQFISTSALWTSEYIAALSTHGIPNIPGFHMSETHRYVMGKALSTSQNFWDISSSAQKPYSSFLGIFAEYGVIYPVFFMYLFIKRLTNNFSIQKDHILLLSFLVILMVLDVWHDSLFLIFLIILFKGANVVKPRQ